MKTPIRPIFFLSAVLLLSALAAPAPAPVAKPAGESERLKERIDALLKHRLKPDPLPIILPNPFAMVSGNANLHHPDGSAPENNPNTPRVTGLAEELPAGSSSEALARGVAKLRIGGTVTLKGQLQIIINDSPRKEGDIIVLDRKNAMTYLQIVRIANGTLTLRLNEATQTIRY
jgi:hypothetical protein